VWSGANGSNLLGENGQFFIGYTGTAGGTNGRIYWRAGGTNYRVNASGANGDYSEYLQQEDTSEPGDVMIFSSNTSDTVKQSEKPYDQQTLGVVTFTGTSNNNDEDLGERSNDPHWANVGLLGHVYTKVSTENGNIKPGDPLTTSTQKGVAMKATKAGRIIGYSLEDYDGGPKEEKPAWFYWKRPKPNTIVVMVQAGWFDPSAPVPDSINDLLLIINSQSDGKPESFGLVDANGRSYDNIIVAKDAAIANLKSGAITVNNLEVKDETIMNKLIVDTISVNNLKANKIEGLEIIVDKIANLDKLINSLDANHQEASKSATVSAVVGVGNENFSVINLAVDGLATISGDLRVKGSSLIEGILNVIDTLTANNLIVGKWADFIGSVVFRGEINFIGRPTFNKDTAGFALIKKDYDNVSINFEKEYVQIPNINISINLEKFGETTEQKDLQIKLEQDILIGDIRYIVTKSTTKGFEIKLNKNAPVDLKFSWMAIAVKDATTTSQSENNSFLTPTASPIPTPIISMQIDPSLTPTQTETPTPSLTTTPSLLPTSSVTTETPSPSPGEIPLP
jgi:hypothetical protein